jgi:hypothetical protein
MASRNVHTAFCRNSADPWSVTATSRYLVVLILPRNRNGLAQTVRLEHREVNLDETRGLVKMSASWSLLDRNLTVRVWRATRSRTK